MGRALDWQDDWRFTENLHVVEAMWMVALSTVNRLEICFKLVHEALEGEADALAVLHAIGSDEYEDEWPRLVACLKILANTLH